MASFAPRCIRSYDGLTTTDLLKSINYEPTVLYIEYKSIPYDKLELWEGNDLIESIDCFYSNCRGTQTLTVKKNTDYKLVVSTIEPPITKTYEFKTPQDNDGDGYCADSDCNDNNDKYYQEEWWYEDEDGDGFGSDYQYAAKFFRCGPPFSGSWANNNLDCDDDDPTKHPNTVWYWDYDRDGYGDSNSTTYTQCEKPGNLQGRPYVLVAGDECPMDDRITTQMDCSCSNEPDTDGDEVLDCMDNCPLDPLKTEPGDCGCGVQPQTWYYDYDSDGYGDDNDTIEGCEDTEPPLKNGKGYAKVGGDKCLERYGRDRPIWYDDVDGDGKGHGGALASCNDKSPKVTNNSDKCPGLHDDNIGKTCDDGNPCTTGDIWQNDCSCRGTLQETKTWYKDEDKDGFSDGISKDSCHQPIDYYLEVTLKNHPKWDQDCDDNNEDIHPDAIDGDCDDIDENCDGEASCDDQCPDDPNKTVAGECGCGVLDTCMVFASAGNIAYEGEIYNAQSFLLDSITASLPEGLGCLGDTLYQWENSTDNGKTWLPIPNATHQNYRPTNERISRSTCYRRLVKRTCHDSLAWQASDTLCLHICTSPPIFISTNAQTICEGGQTQLLTFTSGDEYRWSPTAGLNDPTIPNPIATPEQTTSYTVIATTESGCMTDSRFVVVYKNPTLILAADTTICASTDIVLPTSAVANSPFNPVHFFVGPIDTFYYEWSPSDLVSDSTSSMPVINLEQDTNFTVILRDYNGCQDTSIIEVTVKDSPQVTTSTQNITCGQNNGAITLTFADNADKTSIAFSIDGGNTYPYIVNDNSSQYSITNLAANDYEVWAKWGDGDCPIFIEQVNISEIPNLTVRLLSNYELCTGSIRVLIPTLTNGQAPFSYQWYSRTNAANEWTIIADSTNLQYTLNGLTIDTEYRIEVTDAIGCINTAETLVSVKTSPTVSIMQTNEINCANRSAFLVVQPQDANFTYDWNTGASAGAIKVDSAGLYTVTVTNELGCSTILTRSVTVDTTIEAASIMTTGPITCDRPYAALTALPRGMSYQWAHTASQSGSVTVIMPGEYKVTITNPISECTTDTSIVVTEDRNEPAVRITGEDISCANPKPILSASPTGEGYKYKWSTGDTTTQISVASAGEYVVTVTGPNGCPGIASKFVNGSTNSPTLILQKISDITCTNPEAVLLAIAPRGNVDYLWSTGSSEKSIKVDNPGNYSVTITDKTTGCTSTDKVIVLLDNVAPQVNIEIEGELTCDNSVILTATPSGLDYVWSNKATTQSIEVSSAGTYTVIATGKNGCSGTFEIGLQVNHVLDPGKINGKGSYCPGEIPVKITSLAPASVSNEDYRVIYQWQMLDPSGIVGIWQDIPNTNTLEYQPTALNYTMQFRRLASTQSCDWKASNSIEFRVEQGVIITDGKDQATCLGIPIQLKVGGGTKYEWTPTTGLNNPIIANPIANPTETTIYTVKVFNKEGCSATKDITVTVNIPEVATIQKSNDLDCTNSTSNLTANIGQTYLWSNDSTSRTITVSEVDDYSVTVTDSNGCESTASMTVTSDTSAPQVTIAKERDLTCANTTSILTASEGGVAYLWSNDSIAREMTVTEAGDYSVTVTYANGCESTASMTVTSDTSAPQVTIAKERDLTCTNTTSILTASEGGIAYLWSNDSTSRSMTVIEAGDYSITVTYANGCESTASMTVTSDTNAPAVAIQKSNDLDCQQSTSMLTASDGGVAYLWSNDSTSRSMTVTKAGDYSVTLTYSNGCKSTASMTVTSDTIAPIVSIEKNANGFGCGIDTIELTTNTAGSYLWSTGDTTANIKVTQVGAYSVTVTGVNGCVGSAIITLEAATEDSDGDGICDAEDNCPNTPNPDQLDTDGDGQGDVCDHCDQNDPTADTDGDGTPDCEDECYLNPYLITPDSCGCGIAAIISNTTTTDSSYYEVDSLIIKEESMESFTNVTVQGGGRVELKPGFRFGAEDGERFRGFIQDSVNITYDALVSAGEISGSQSICSSTDTLAIIESVSEATTDLGGTIIYQWQYSLNGTDWMDDPKSTNTPTYTPWLQDTITYFRRMATLASCGDWMPTDSVIIRQATELMPLGHRRDTICQGDTIQLIAAAGGVTYTWLDVNGLSDPTIQNPLASPTVRTTYPVIITDEIGCSITDTFTIHVNRKPQFDLGEDQAICLGDSIRLTSSSVSTYTREWRIVGEDAIISTEYALEVKPTETTEYNVLITNPDGGCFREDNITIHVFDPTDEPETVEVIACAGDGVSLFSDIGQNHQWTPSTGLSANNIATPIANPDTTTIYKVVFEIDENCTDSLFLKVTVPPTYETGLRDTSIIEGDSLYLAITDASSVVWSTQDSTNTIWVKPDTTTTYSVTITTVHGCTLMDSITVTVDSLPVITEKINAGPDQTICQGDMANLIATGGIRYVWSTGDTTERVMVTPNITTTYLVTGFDAAGNQGIDSVTVFVQIPSAISITPPSSICLGDSITLMVTGGVTYLWDNAAETTATIRVAPTETTTYNVVVTDTSRCTDSTLTTEITVLTDEVITLPSIQVACAADTIILDATKAGATAYLWSNDSTTANIQVTGGQATKHSVTITYEDDCTSIEEYPINVLPAIQLALDKEEPSCLGNNGQIIIEGDSIVAGVAIEYRLEGMTVYTTDRVFSNLPPGEYIVYARYQGGANCEVSDVITLVPAVEDCIVITINPTDTTICMGESVTLTATGGTNYTWSNGATTPSITVDPTETTIYRVAATNATGQSGNASITVNVVDIAVEISESMAICSGEPIMLDAFNSSATDYRWSTGDSTRVISVRPTQTTDYTVTVTVGACTETATTTITVLADSILIEPSRQICAGDSTTLMATGGKNYEWTLKGSNEVIATTAFLKVGPTNNTAYQVKITSENGCTGISEYPITILSAIPLTLTKTDPSCDNNRQDGSIQITSSGTIDNQDLEFSLHETGPYDQAQSFSNLSAGNYTIYARYVADTTCMTIATIELVEPMDCNPPCTLSLSAEVTAPDCPVGTNNGSIVLIPSDSLANMEYRLDNGAWQSGIDQFFNLAPGNYEVSGQIIGTGCTTTITVTVPEPLQACDCDSLPPVIDCNPNLVAGDISIIGFDNDVDGADGDKLLISNLVDLAPGATFSLTNAIYGSGADSTGWLAVDGSSDVVMQTIVYRGQNTIPAGSIICFELPASGVGNEALAHTFSINGEASEDFCTYHTGTVEGAVNLRTDAPTALFILEGVFTEAGNSANFCGNVLSGLMDGGTWVELGTSNPAGSNRSTVHPHLDCFYIQGATTPEANAAYYNGNPPPATDDAYDVLSALINYATWATGTIPDSACEQEILPASN